MSSLPNSPDRFISLDILRLDADSLPSLFLSVWKESVTQEKLLGEFGKLESRYCLSGLLNGRIVADQRYNIGSVKALFVSSSSKHHAASTIETIISLLYGLARAGSESLAVVCPIPGDHANLEQEKIQEAVKLLHGSKTYPTVQICALHAQSMKTQPWWNVYEDKIVVVHIHWLDITSLVYLITLRDHLNCSNSSATTNSVLYIPPDTADLRMCRATFGDIATPKVTMPVIEDATNTEVATKIWFVLVATAPCYEINLKGWIFLRPADEDQSQRLLRRGFQQQCRWQSLYPNLCKEGYFPWHSNTRTSSQNIEAIKPATGTSMVIRKGCTFVVEDRMSEMKSSLCIEESDCADEYTVRSFLCDGNIKTTSCSDDNEISLSDSEDEEETLDNQCWLYVLGTGCAAPSAHRNASAHVIVLRGKSILLDAGEGTTLQWQRHISDRSIASISIIWISHAHWDHFGGLVEILKRIHELRPHKKNKRPRGESPFVVAPRKIFQYLEMAFNRDTMTQFYQGVFSSDRTAIKGMIEAFNRPLSGVRISNWINSLVVHSCLAYGVRIEFDFSACGSFSIVFSGDTRPTFNVRNLCQPHADLMVHEATYMDAELEMAKAKKHSTRSEAISIGRGLAKRILLTHFSQRYNIVRIETGRDEQTGTMWMTAVDGLRLPIIPRQRGRQHGKSEYNL